MQEYIRIQNARLNNLKNVTVDIPRNKQVVVTGLSGSGKSTLIFDTLHKESQRQFMGAYGIVTYGLQKPAVDSILGLSPSIAIGQQLVNHNPLPLVNLALSSARSCSMAHTVRSFASAFPISSRQPRSLMEISRASSPISCAVMLSALMILTIGPRLKSC